MIKIKVFSKVKVEQAKKLYSQLTIKDTSIEFDKDLDLSSYDLCIEEAIIFAFVCHCYENDKHFSITLIKKKYGVAYSYSLISNCLNVLEDKGFIYRQVYYKPIFAPVKKCDNEYYMDVIRFLISNSKRYNEENIYINIIDALLNDITDVEFCFGCKHFKGNNDESFCDMCGYKNDALCRNSLIERAKRNELEKG